MEIKLNHDEICEAILNYAASIGINTDNTDFEVHLTAGRGQNGYSAELKPANAKKTRKTTTKKKPTKAKEEPVAEAEPETVAEEESPFEPEEVPVDENPGESIFG